MYTQCTANEISYKVVAHEHISVKPNKKRNLMTNLMKSDDSFARKE
jgi:hypothetical protein